jgi:hypothetical protein
MVHRSSPRGAWVRKGSSLGTSLLVLLLLVACSGSNDSTVKHSQTPLASPKSSPTAPGASGEAGLPPPQPGSASNTPVAFDGAGLHITSTSIECPATTEFGVEHGELVLAQDRLIYSDAEIAQMQAYLAAPPAGPLPPTLRWVPVSAGGDTPSSPASPGVGCGTDLEITNTGQATVQIPQIGVHLRADPQPNTYRYPLVDSCSLSTDACPSGHGNPDCLYKGSITLNSKAAGSLFTSQLLSICGPGVLTLDPGQTQDVLLLLFSTGTPANLDYPILPQLTVTTPSGPQVISLSPLATTVNFANDSQFSCYTLQGNTFVLVTPEQADAAENLNCGDLIA